MLKHVLVGFDSEMEKIAIAGLIGKALTYPLRKDPFTTAYLVNDVANRTGEAFKKVTNPKKVWKLS